MSTKTLNIGEQAASTPTDAHPGQEQTQSLQQILDIVRRDSQMEPQVYLEESKVPHGGE